MADIPQEVREAAAKLAAVSELRPILLSGEADDHLYIEVCHAMFLAGERAGMERAAEIAVELDISPDYSEQALADRCIDFLEERAEVWMAETGVRRMFNAISSVFAPYAPQDVMDRFREKLGVIGRQCHVEGALRVWEEIAAQQRALGTPLPPQAIRSENDGHG